MRRVVCLLLLPCLLVDSAIAASFHHPLSPTWERAIAPGERGEGDIFAGQALALRLTATLNPRNPARLVMCATLSVAAFGLLAQSAWAAPVQGQPILSAGDYLQFVLHHPNSPVFIVLLVTIASASLTFLSFSKIADASRAVKLQSERQKGSLFDWQSLQDLQNLEARGFDKDILKRWRMIGFWATLVFALTMPIMYIAIIWQVLELNKPLQKPAGPSAPSLIEKARMTPPGLPALVIPVFQQTPDPKQAPKGAPSRTLQMIGMTDPNGRFVPMLLDRRARWSMVGFRAGQPIHAGERIQVRLEGPYQHLANKGLSVEMQSVEDAATLKVPTERTLRLSNDGILIAEVEKDLPSGQGVISVAIPPSIVTAQTDSVRIKSIELLPSGNTSKSRQAQLDKKHVPSTEEPSFPHQAVRIVPVFQQKRQVPQAPYSASPRPLRFHSVADGRFRYSKGDQNWLAAVDFRPDLLETVKAADRIEIQLNGPYQHLVDKLLGVVVLSDKGESGYGTMYARLEKGGRLTVLEPLPINRVAAIAVSVSVGLVTTQTALVGIQSIQITPADRVPAPKSQPKKSSPKNQAHIWNDKGLYRQLWSFIIERNPNFPKLVKSAS